MIEKKFNEYFSRWKIILPRESIKERKPGTIKSHGWFIQYLFGSNNKGDYLDFYASHRMTEDDHIRLYSSGEVEDLPALWGMIVYASEQGELNA